MMNAGGTVQGGAGSGGSVSAGGASTGGSSGGSTPVAGTGGTAAGTGGSTQAGAGGSSGAAGGSAGSTSDAGTGGTSGGSGTSCTLGAFPAADPGAAGPFTTVTETNVGPAVGEGDDGGPAVAFTMFRPEDLSESGLCHPVVTWGNGTGSTPSLYGVFLRHLASHGFVVIASDSKNVSRGDPLPMVAGVEWVIEQNDDPTSALYGRIDTAHVGATGHSQGGFATTAAAGDPRITTIAPLCGAQQQRNLSGPAFIFCGGEDTTVPCENVEGAFNAITDLPAMFANYITADHANFITFRGMTVTPVEEAVTAWMRVHLMDDAALRSRFYGSDCALCTDSDWEIAQKNMDQ
jgi:dienelactone hydrolase